MNKFIIFAFCLSTFLFLRTEAQQTRNIEGKVYQKTNDNKRIPIQGTNVYWKGTTLGTSTDENGYFKIKFLDGRPIIISHIGFRNDTIWNVKNSPLSIELSESILLEGAQKVVRQQTSTVSLLSQTNIVHINEKELLKAACCNLSESFETNPSVDVSFTDAVTGTKQIRMLGLSGPYSQITQENMPGLRGLASIYGMTYIPGTWIESIQLNKGTGSVANGFESITGQINVELRKPETADKLYLNLFSNEGGRLEANANWAHKFNEKWSMAVLLHGKSNPLEWDKNNDGFLDMPVGNNAIGLARWKYIGDHGIRLQFGVKGTHSDNIGGQLIPDGANESSYWKMNLDVDRIEGWAKLGKVYEDQPWKSIGFQVSGSTHTQKSNFGLNTYNANQSSFYSNLLYQSRIVNDNHKFRTGVSFQYDAYEELYKGINYNRKEIVPGAYAEYTFNLKEKLGLVAGIRGDYHNLFGFFTTPRFHLRYAPFEKSVFRASAGRGLRTANIFSENNGLMASSRQFIIDGANNNLPYGLNPEIAWNYGLNYSQKFKLDYRDGSVSFDFYRTDFINQIVVDLDQNTREVHFYNLEGESYSNSFQAQFDYELIKRLDLRIAYRWYDVKSTYNEMLMDKPLLASHRAFLNLAYETKNHWKFDYTFNWQGEKRIPFTADSPIEYQLPEKSPSFYLMNAQISKKWRETFEVYLGAENLLGFKQKNPILSASQPFGDYFDSSMIWGPLFGRKIYMGLRFKIL